MVVLTPYSNVYVHNAQCYLHNDSTQSFNNAMCSVDLSCHTVYTFTRSKVTLLVCAFSNSLRSQFTHDLRAPGVFKPEGCYTTEVPHGSQSLLCVWYLRDIRTEVFSVQVNWLQLGTSNKYDTVLGNCPCKLGFTKTGNVRVYETSLALA